MPNYKSYPSKSDTASRKTRKGTRITVFQFNRTASAKRKKAAREARNEG